MTATALMNRARINDLRVDGISVRYAIAGEGPAVLLVHGLATSMITWCRNIDALADAGFTAIALDLPGYGGSGLAMHRGYTPESAAEFLVDFADEMGIGRFSVVGNSAGGLVAGITALEFPDRVENVALVGSAGLGKRVSWPLRLISIPVVGELVYKPQMISKEALIKRIFYRPPEFLDEIIPEMVRVRCLPHGAHVMLQSVRSGINLLGLRPEHQILSRLAQLQARLLAVWGEDDLVIPPIKEEDILSAVPGSTVHVLPECGHWPQMEKPEEFNEILTSFLSRPSTFDSAPAGSISRRGAQDA
jgi:4,5:9,10-diseco-3-hydroxy-5,9,17-trioxoandrosta-1(10),2-diene-4-oate hydrolase